MTLRNNSSEESAISSRILQERETRKRLLNFARQEGFEKEMLLLFAKYDKMMRLCNNEKERYDMAQLGAVEMYNLLGGGGHLVVDGKLVIEDKALTEVELSKSKKTEE